MSAWQPVRPTASTPVWTGTVLDPNHPIPTFGAPTWDLRATCDPTLGQTRATCRLDFRRVPQPELVQAVKEWAYWRLNTAAPSTPAASRNVKPTTVASQMTEVIRWLQHCQQLGKLPCETTTHDGRDYLANIEQARGIPLFRRAAHTLNSLHVYRDDLSAPLTPEVFRVPQFEGADDNTYENSTPRVPEPVMAQILAAAFVHVDVVTPDLVAAIGCLAEQREREAATQAKNRSTRHPYGWVQTALRVYLDEMERTSTPLPNSIRRKGWPSLTAIGSDTGLTKLQLARHRKEIQRTAAKVGVEFKGLNVPIAKNPLTGQPWYPKPLDPIDVHIIRAQVLAACIIVIAYLTGMRESEVLSIRPAQDLITEEADDGRLRYLIRSRVHKKRAPGGDEAQWATIKAAHDAVRAIAAVEAAWMSCPDREGARRVRRHDPSSASIGQLFDNMHAAIREVSRFVSFINRTWTDAAENPFIPLVDGKTWRLTLNQTRRTLAWHISKRPFGLVALKIQYQHLHGVISEGYAGTSASGFEDEIVVERQIAGALAAFAAAADLDTGTPIIVAPHLKSDLASIAGDVDVSVPMPILLTDNEARLRVRHLGDKIHYGPLNLCVYDSSKARCWADTAPDERIGGPRVRLCQPAACQNAVITQDHLPAYEQDTTEVEVELKLARKQKPRPASWIKQLEARLATNREIIATLTGGQT